MCSNEDFLSWSDVDLDAILIDFTADDLGSEFSDETSSNVTTTTKTTTKNCVRYVLPRPHRLLSITDY